MLKLTVTDEQADLISRTSEEIRVYNSKGHLLGYLSPIFTADELAEAKRAFESDQPRYTTEQVLAHLRSLEQ